jgi:dTDP-4-dehydrorhamnose reductase
MKPTIAVTGSNGQLGWELQQLASAFEVFEFIFTDRSTLDISNESAFDVFFQQHQPKFLINAAAYTAVDKAESDQANALLVNATAVGYLAAACQKYNCQLIHISTDYVFNGNATNPYQPNDTTDPVNYYGYTKLQGELLAQQNCPESIIIRTSWVYSSHGNNFVKTMVRLMQQRESINVVADQTGSPTFAKDLAEAILIIIQEKLQGNTNSGIYHFSNEGVITWYDFAVAIKELIHSNCAVHPIPTTAYPTTAKRPLNSAMNLQKLVSDFGVTLKPWSESLQVCVQQLSAL